MKVKYLSASFFGSTCTTDLSAVFLKFYGQFNNIFCQFLVALRMKCLHFTLWKHTAYAH